MQTADDIFDQLNGGEKFSKLDLSSAYQQVLLAEESKQYVTINTHLSLFRYTRLPFGVSSSPAIFQKMMYSLTRGLTAEFWTISSLPGQVMKNTSAIWKEL